MGRSTTSTSATPTSGGRSASARSAGFAIRAATRRRSRSRSATPTAGPAPLAVNFSSAGSSDPEGQTLTYAWTFGDGGTSTAANPSHTYTQAGQYSARLSVSDGVNTTLSTPISISVGSPPTATILSPQDGSFFVAGDVISYSGDGTDPDDGTLPASAFSWNDRLPARRPRPPRDSDQRRQERHVHDPDQRPRLQRQHPLPDHAHGHGLDRSDRNSIRPDLSTQGESLLQHGTGGPHRLSRRRRQDDTVRLRHA